MAEHPTVGLKGQASMIVGEDDTARVVGSGAVDVLGTPIVVALMERAAVAALAGALPAGKTSVGTEIQVQHTAPTPPGLQVTAEATLTHIDGRRLQFEIMVSDEVEVIARGTHTRVIVDLERFRQRADAKQAASRSHKDVQGDRESD